MGIRSEGRRVFSYQERRELWHRWKSGEGLGDIAAALGTVHVSVRSHIVRHFGFEPRAGKRSDRTLGIWEREEISRGLSAGRSLGDIGRSLGRCTSTISREVQRNGGRAQYRACKADQRAWRQARRPKQCLLAANGRLRQMVGAKLQRQWSPQQISHWLGQTFPEDRTMQVSHETIYRTLFIQARGALKKQLLTHLRRGTQIRRPQAQGRPRSKCGRIIGALSIRERPAEAADRAVPGHWEGDLLCGGHSSQIGTLVERSSRFVMLIKLDSRGTEDVTSALAKHIRKLPRQLRRSLTWDRGLELAEHARFTVSTDVKVYFCDPHSPWQRGSNENTNGLLRQYFPKGQDFSRYSQAELNKVAQLLNERPRKTLGYRSPTEVLNEYIVASTR